MNIRSNGKSNFDGQNLIPNLIQVQLDSFEWFKTQGIKEILDDVSPIEDSRFELKFIDHKFKEPENTEEECRQREITYDAALWFTALLKIKETKEEKEQEIFVGKLPVMTSNGTFIINGAERVVVSQLVRSPGVYFSATNEPISGRPLANAKLIPSRGSWVEFETSTKNILSVKIDRKRRIPISIFLRALAIEGPCPLGIQSGCKECQEIEDYNNSIKDEKLKKDAEVHTIPKENSDDHILNIFKDVDSPTDPLIDGFIKTTLNNDNEDIKSRKESLIEFYKRIRPGEPPNEKNAEELIETTFFNERRYDLGNVGRYKLNNRLGRKNTELKTLDRDDFIHIIKKLILINNSKENKDDIDHLGNRRVRAVGELIQNQMRVGLLRMERVAKERMITAIEPQETAPQALINIRPVVAAVKEFFGGSQLSQFMDQTNPLSELTHKRRLSALGPGGLSRERAGFDVRDVHSSHYGRICPIETPEGPNIGLLGSLATFARTNEHGFIETPYRLVKQKINSKDPSILGRTVTEDITEGKKIVLPKNKKITRKIIEEILKLPEQELSVVSYVSSSPEDIKYLSADLETSYNIAQASSPIDNNGEFINAGIEIRKEEEFVVVSPEIVDLIDISPMQLVSVSTSLIPFLEHDDANRALMGSNMQRQAVPLISPQAPIVGTGMERIVARDSGQVQIAKSDGLVISSTGIEIQIMDEENKVDKYPIKKYVRSNQGTTISQRPIVSKGDIVRKGQVLCDSSSTESGNLALGQNILCAFMSWDGYNFEDAIILSDRLVKCDIYTSIHIEKLEVEARDTKLGPEEITADIPNIGEEALKNLDEEGIVRIGAEVGPGDILAGKITPKGETELSAEEKLLRAIFGEKARDVKDTSLRVPHGQRGKVIDVRVLDSKEVKDLPPGVNRQVRVWIAQTRKISEGDKMAGRHGNKGVVAKILPQEDMPYLEDGTPVDIILNPIGVPSRMNLGQVLELHLGWAARALSMKSANSSVFESFTDNEIEEALLKAWVVRKSGALDDVINDHLSHDKANYDKLYEWLQSKNKENLMGFFTKTDKKPPSSINIQEECLRMWFEEETNENISECTIDDLKEKVDKLNKLNKFSSPNYGKEKLYDGRTGEAFAQPIAVGFMYMLKLIHMVEDKIHARSTGPYSLITQQPLGGKAQFGGQRFGEMEVWALEAYSSAHNLQEILTVKSDDVVGRVKTYESIVKGEPISQPGIPESFHVLLKELQSLGLSVDLMHDFDSESDLDLSGIVEDVDLITSVNEENNLLISEENSDISTDSPDETILSENINLEDITLNDSTDSDTPEPDIEEIESDNSDSAELEIKDIPETKEDESLDSDTVEKE
ncbi:MAG: DNA-directed RNA polymerase subunit beta [Chloroflexi bacterium]|nr:DNA-directed RNA polymerase subunit beta [Chloroflexota bacterium]|tara:strand:- start:2601 stop:6650 length:4050 start_codon:yes stop_codon:yes gene_type:complete